MLPTDFPSLNAVDMSRWGGELSRAEAQCLWDHGIRLLIVGTGHPNGAGMFARQQAEMWLDVTNGVGVVDAYIYLYFLADPIAQVGQALSTLAGLPVRRWWLDAEDTDSEQLTPTIRESFLLACCGALNGRPRGIYTGQWWWRPRMNNSQTFAGLPLWNSWYDRDPDEDGLPYGGWVHSAIEQFEGTTDICGQSVDLNYAKDLAETSDEMTVKELNAAIMMREDFRNIASGDFELLKKAHYILESAGMLPVRDAA